MNIFILDFHPVLAAKCQMDKHTVSQSREAVEMLVAASGTGLINFAPAHAKHPCTLWVGRSKANHTWLCLHALALFAEYTERYNKRHAYQDIAEFLYEKPHIDFKTEELTPFALAMPEEYKTNCPVVSYRQYYKSKARFATWKQNKPDWWNKEIVNELSN